MPASNSYAFLTGDSMHHRFPSNRYLKYFTYIVLPCTLLFTLIPFSYAQIPASEAGLTSTEILTKRQSETEVNYWSGEGEAGIVLVDGNSNSKIINVGLSLSKNIEDWEHTIKLAANTAENNGDKSAESYLAAYNIKYDFSEKSFLFGDLRYLDDKFDSFNGITTIGGGYGYRISNTELFKWSVNAGLGYRNTEFDSIDDDISGVAFIGESDFRFKLSETAEITDVFRIEATSDNSYLQNILGLSVAMNSLLSLKISYDVRYNSDPAEGDTDTDSITAVSLVYKF